MQPVSPAALQLALRLRQLRQLWPQARLTQNKIAAAFSEEESLAAATVSSWESLKSPKLPPAHRLEAYARFFASQRSVAGQPRLLPFDQLTSDETQAYRELKTELTALRNSAGGGTPETEATFSRSWYFPDASPITFVCAQLPESMRGKFGDPSDPNYTELQTYADIDALIELHGHIRAENPTATVHFRTPPNVKSDDLSGHLILLGGVVWNEITGRLTEMAKLPVRQVDKGLDSGEIFVAEADGEEREFWPQFHIQEGRKVLTEDVGLLARVPNPLNTSRTLTICNGIHSRGVYGAVRTLTDAALRESNERYISTVFGDVPSFAILMSVPVIKNEATTPDFNSEGAVRFQWSRRD